MASLDGPIFAPAPDLPPGSRNALVIATSSYADARLSQLRSPGKDAEDLAAVLADPAIGGFKVTALIDSTESRIRRGIAAFLAGRGPDETVLVYLSCHGIQDAHGRLLFAATDTEADYPNATAVRAATDLLDELDECAASRQILILDCCFSGSFSDSKGGRKGELNLERQLRGHSRGREVLTASRGFEYSFEGEPLDGVITGSVFTTGLVQGLRTGAADTDKNGHITVEEAYEYAFAYVRGALAPQTPQRWLFSSEGTKIVLARSISGRAVIPARLPVDLADNLESRFPGVRIGAINEIADWLTDPDPARQLAAWLALQDVVEDDVRKVSDVARSHLEPFIESNPLSSGPVASGLRVAPVAPLRSGSVASGVWGAPVVLRYDLAASGPWDAPVAPLPSGQVPPVSQGEPDAPPSLSFDDAVQAARKEGRGLGESVTRDAPALWLEAVLARKPIMPSDLEARLLQGSALPIDFLLNSEVRHALRQGFWDVVEQARAGEQTGERKAPRLPLPFPGRPRPHHSGG
jgi:Caspase domain